jgi:hypothetical protein
MAINDEIAAGVKPIQIENPLNNMVKFANIQNDMANMALHRQKMELATADAARQAELDRYIGGGGRDESIIYGLRGIKDLTELRQGETAKRLGEKTAGETLDAGLARHRKMLGEWVNNPEEARQWLATGFGDPVTKKHYESSGSYGDLAKRIPNDPAAFADWKEKAVIGMDKFLTNREAKHFSDTGGQIIASDSQNRPIGAPMDKTLTPEQRMYAPTDLEAKQARYNVLKKQTADQDALIARAGTAGLPGTADMLTEQQRQRTVEQDVLRGEIDVLQKQGQTAKNTIIAPIQLLNELDLLIKNGKGDSQRAKDVRGLIDKEKHIAETEQYTPQGLDLAADLVKNGVVPPRGGKGAINAAAAAGVTAKDYVEGKASLGALGALNKQFVLTEAFAKTFNANADATLKSGLALNGRTGVPIIDEYIANPLSRSSGKNPELAGFSVYLKGTLNEYAKIVSGTTGNAAIAQKEIAEMKKLLNSAQTREQLISAINAMKAEVANRRKGFIQQKAEMRGEALPAEAEVAAPHAHPKTKGRDTTNPLLTPS